MVGNMENRNKKIIAIVFSIIMVMSVGFILVSNINYNPDNNIGNHNVPFATNSTTLNQVGKQVGATNSGLIVPESKLGNGTGLGNPLTTASFDGDTSISSDGSTYGVISGTDTLQFNTTISLTSGFIGYNIAIKPGAHVTLSGMIINEMDNGQGYNNYTMGQLNLSNDKIHGQPGVAMHNCINADYTNSSFIYGNAKIKINHGVNDVFYQNAQVIIGGTTSGDIFNYGSSPTLNNLTIVNDVKGGGLITDSYFNNTAGYFNNDNNKLTITYSDISYNTSYVYNDAMAGYGGSGGGQLPEQDVNLSYDKFVPVGNNAQYISEPYFNYATLYNNYYNFTMPSSTWGNSADVQAYYKMMQGTTSEHAIYRGSLNVNDSLYPVKISHNEFAGGNGFELYGSGSFNVTNNVITAQNYWTAYITMFPQYNLIAKNSQIANNTFYFYGDATLENDLSTIGANGGGNTYISSGETGVQIGVNILNNTFDGDLFTVIENTNQHASFILGNYLNVKYNYFTVPTTWNSGDSIVAPEMEIDDFSTAGSENISFNYFNSLTSDTVAFAGIPVSSATTYGTIDMANNTYRGTTTSEYQITAYTSYTVNVYNTKNYQIITKSSTTLTMVSGNSPNGYTANYWTIANVTITADTISIKSSLNPANIGSNVTFSAIVSGSYSISSYSWNINGNTYTTPNVSYIFNKSGSYKISLKAEDSDHVYLYKNLTETIRETNLVIHSSANPIFKNQSATFNFTVTNFTVTSVKWNVNGDNFTNNSFTYTFPKIGAYKISLTLTNANGVNLYKNYTENVIHIGVDSHIIIHFTGAIKNVVISVNYNFIEIKKYSTNGNSEYELDIYNGSYFPLQIFIEPITSYSISNQYQNYTAHGNYTYTVSIEPVKGNSFNFLQNNMEYIMLAIVVLGMLILPIVIKKGTSR